MTSFPEPPQIDALHGRVTEGKNENVPKIIGLQLFIESCVHIQFGQLQGYTQTGKLVIHLFEFLHAGQGAACEVAHEADAVRHGLELLQCPGHGQIGFAPTAARQDLPLIDPHLCMGIELSPQAYHLGVDLRGVQNILVTLSPTDDVVDGIPLLHTLSCKSTLVRHVGKQGRLQRGTVCQQSLRLCLGRQGRPHEIVAAHLDVMGVQPVQRLIQEVA